MWLRWSRREVLRAKGLPGLNPGRGISRPLLHGAGSLGSATEPGGAAESRKSAFFSIQLGSQTYYPDDERNEVVV